jgi:heptaprenyl diphosphate synthase
VSVEELRYKVFLSLLASMAIVIHAIESSIPTPFPWLKFGMANIVTLAVVVIFGLRAAMTVTILRVFIGTLLMGTFLTPAFFLAISGGVASTLVLAIAYRYLGRKFSTVGISVMGAFTHTSVQIVVAYLILIRHFQIFMLLPLFLIFSLLAGILSGLGAEFLIRHLKEVPNITKIAKRGR